AHGGAGGGERGLKGRRRKGEGGRAKVPAVRSIRACSLPVQACCSPVQALPVPENLAAKIPEILAGQRMNRTAWRGGRWMAAEGDREISSRADRRVGGGQVPMRFGSSRSGSVPAPAIFGRRRGRSGCSPAEPYPPGRLREA